MPMLWANSRIDVAEGPQRLCAHVLGGVDAEAVEVGVGDPEAVDEATRQARAEETLRILPVPLGPEVERLQAEHVPLDVLGVVVPVGDVPLAEEQRGPLELPGPDCAVGPGRFQPGGIGRIDGQRRPAVAVVEALDGVRLAVPARVVVRLPRGRIVRSGSGPGRR